MVSLQLSVAAQTISLHQAFFPTWAFSPKGLQLVKKHVATLLELHEVQAAGSSGSWHKHTLQYFWKWCIALKPTRHGHSDGMQQWLRVSNWTSMIIIAQYQHVWNSPPQYGKHCKWEKHNWFYQPHLMTCHHGSHGQKCQHSQMAHWNMFRFPAPTSWHSLMTCSPLASPT